MALPSMNLLAIETATDTVGAALVRHDGGSTERVHVGGRQHAERLVPMIEEVCAASGCPLDSVDAVAVDVGPGLFTGLRVGVATAKALAQARGLGIIGLSSLDVLAAAAAGRALAAGLDRVEMVVPVVDARRGEVFTAAYRMEKARPVPTPAARGTEGDGALFVDVAVAVDDCPDAVAPEDLVPWLSGLTAGPGSVLVVGDGAVRYLRQLSEDPALDLGWASSLAAPPPTVLARLAVDRLATGAIAAAPEEIVADYRRPADVRINWEQRAERQERPEPPEPAEWPEAGSAGTDGGIENG
jgi:tRNA threonylcarbamoyladenosine biosynthesis protein TsaB